MKRLREQSRDDLRALRWLPDRVADAVFERLHSPGETMVGSNG